MEIQPTFYAKDRETWHAWLEENHQRENRLWLIFTRVHSGEPCIRYEDALDEALCYGWIDSLIQRIDEERYARLFTRRTDANKWSAVNRARVKQLIAQGRMQPAGLALLPKDLDDEIVPRAHPEREELPEFIRVALESSPAALAFFEQLPPSQKRLYLGWILDARREETRQKRLAEALQKLANGERMGLK